MIIRRVQRILSTRYYHTSTSSSSSNISDDQLGLLKSLGYRDLQRLAKLHNINARQKGTVLIQELSEILPATLLSKRTTKWMPPQEDETDPDPVNMNTQVYATRQDQAAAKDHDHDSAAVAQLLRQQKRSGSVAEWLPGYQSELAAFNEAYLNGKILCAP